MRLEKAFKQAVSKKTDTTHSYKRYLFKLLIIPLVRSLQMYELLSVECPLCQFRP